MEFPSDEPLTKLRRIIGYDLRFDDGSGPMRVGYALRFHEAVLLIEADGGDDTIEVTVGPGPEFRHQESDPTAVDLSDDEPWRSVLGRDLGWRWLLVNQQGYRDGLQLEFCVPGVSDGVILQWMGEASEVRVGAVQTHC